MKKKSCKTKTILADNEFVTLSDLGYTIEDISDINNVDSGISKVIWMNFIPGNNKLEFSGDGVFSVECKIPMKVGGFIDV